MHDTDDPPIREFADRGTLWLLESTSNLRDLVAMAAREVADSLDFERAERVNRSFVPADLHKQEADLLYRVPFRTGKSEVWVYLLVEHQSKPDRLMGLRVLSYMVQV
ncbi:MAG: Rpn family recombination-promoting nuclease/putative transposase, partial [Armatimonadetes bacterium]|nr:Rpn family recombination-promoting nuclease/putative transposase [Armatimonadota bacterium]